MPGLQAGIRDIAVADPVVLALQQMRDQRVRAVLVIDDGRLTGIVTQGDCAIEVLLPGPDARQTLVREVLTANPMTVKPSAPLEACIERHGRRGRARAAWTGARTMSDRHRKPTC